MKRVIQILALTVALTNLAAAHDYYPLEVGYHWEYDGIEVNDLGLPIPGTNYDSYMTIMGEILMQGNNYFIFHDSSNQGGSWEPADTNFWREVGDTLKMLLPLFESTTYLEADLAILPRPSGTTWTVVYLDTTFLEQGEPVHFVVNWTGEIEDLETVNVPAGTFSNCYHLVYQQEFELEFTQPETTMTYNNRMEVWLAFDVGLVKKLEFPTEGPGGSDPGMLEELSDYVVPVAPSSALSPATNFRLDPTYPNPFNPVTRISYQLSAPSDAHLVMYNLAGEVVQRLYKGRQTAGTHEVVLNAMGLPSGIYLVRLQTEHSSATQKVVLLK